MDNKTMIVVSAIMMIEVMTVTGIWASKWPGKPAAVQQVKQPAGHRYLQKCGAGIG